MSFAAATSAKEEDESKESNPEQTSSLVKSLRSVWKKAKQRPSLPGRWRRSVDLEKARQDHSEGQQSFQHLEESREDALFYSMSGHGDQHHHQRSAASQELLDALRASNAEAGGPRLPLLPNPRANYQVDYVNHLIPGLKDILNCPFYWGKMDRYEAEALLANKPEGSFLLRDSAQDDYVFSVSFRRYSRSLHARIEESKHQFSFDCHDPGVHTSKSIRGLLDHYKDPLSCMFFEPMLLFPVLRKMPFSLQDLARTVICDSTTYNGVSKLPIPKTLQNYLREYHYRHKVESRPLEINNGSSAVLPAVMNCTTNVRCLERRDREQ